MIIGQLVARRPDLSVRLRIRNPGSQAAMWPAAIVMADPLAKNGAKVSFAHWNYEVQAFATDRPDHAFAEGIRLWRTHRCFQDPQTHRLKRVVNAFRVDRVAI